MGFHWSHKPPSRPAPDRILIPKPSAIPHALFGGEDGSDRRRTINYSRTHNVQGQQFQPPASPHIDPGGGGGFAPRHLLLKKPNRYIRLVPKSYACTLTVMQPPLSTPCGMGTPVKHPSRASSVFEYPQKVACGRNTAFKTPTYMLTMRHFA